jgi:hypothetical protein
MWQGFTMQQMWHLRVIGDVPDKPAGDAEQLR